MKREERKEELENRGLKREEKRKKRKRKRGGKKIKKLQKKIEILELFRLTLYVIKRTLNYDWSIESLYPG